MTIRSDEKTILTDVQPLDYNATNLKVTIPDDGKIRQNTVPDEPEFKLYTRRWYVLLVFFLTGLMQGWLWNTFGPIGEALKVVGWPISILVATTQVVLWAVSTIGAPICVWMMDKKGLRLATIFATLTLAFACTIRCVTTKSPAFEILNVIAFAIDGLGATVPLSAASALSSVWFPPNERWLATAICVESSNVGIALAMVIGPLMVKVPSHELHVNSTRPTLISPAAIAQVHEDVMRMTYIQTAISILLLLTILFYFPNKPPKPPCMSASVQRTPLMTGMKEAFKSWKLWLLFLPYGTGCGIYYSWTAIYDVILAPIGVSEAQSGWLGFSGTVVGISSAVFVSVFAGRVHRYIKKIVLLCLVLTTVVCVAFTLISIGVLPFSMAWLYVTALIAGAVLYAIVPVSFELASELIYPISENVVCLMVQWWYNVFVIGFYLLLLIPGDRAWINWLVVGCVGSSLVSFFFLPEHYARLAIDDGGSG